MEKKLLFSSVAVVALLAALAGVVQSGGGLQEQTSKPVRPGSHHVLTNAFRAPNVPTNAVKLAHWKLHVPSAKGYYHLKDTQWPNHGGWSIDSFRAANCVNRVGTFECAVLTNDTSELKFQYTFTGFVKPCPVDVEAGAGSGGDGGTPPAEPEPLKPWRVEGRTADSYYVRPSYTNVCWGANNHVRAVFRAVNEKDEPVASTWTSKPDGLTPATAGGVSSVAFSAAAPGQYKVTAVSDQNRGFTDSATVDFVKVEIKALDEPGDILCAGGTRRFKAEVIPSSLSGAFAWSVNHPDKLAFVDGDNTAQTIAVTGLVASAAVNAEELKVEFTPTAATFTCTATTNLTIIKVELVNVPIDHSPLPNLDNPKRICINAQEQYKKVKYRATVKPVGTKARAVSTGEEAAVTFAGVGGTNPNALEDGHEFWVIGGTDTGDYEVTLKHLDLLICTASDGETVFRFVYVHNTKEIASIMQSSADVVTDNSAGGDHNGGHAKVEWSLKDTDSRYLVSAGIGDAAMDVQPDIVGWAKNYNDDSESGENNVEFWAGMSEKGRIQVGTIPKKAYRGNARIRTRVELTAKGRSQGYASMYGSISIGGSIFGIISFSTDAEVNLTGSFACVGGVGLFWDDRAIAGDNSFSDSWRGFDPYMRGARHDLIVRANVSDEGVLPIETSFGFSAGVSLKENMGNPMLTGTSSVRDMKLTIENMQYEIIE